MTLQSIADSIKLIAAFAGIIVIAYSGFILITSRDPAIRAEWKEIILGVIIGLCVVFLAPWLATVFSGGSYCS